MLKSVFLERIVYVFMILVCDITIQLLSLSVRKPVIRSALNHPSNTTGMTMWLRCCVSLLYIVFLCYSTTMCISVNRGGWHLLMTLSDILHPYVHFMISYRAYCVYLCVSIFSFVCCVFYGYDSTILTHFIISFLGLVDMDRVVWNKRYLFWLIWIVVVSCSLHAIRRTLSLSMVELVLRIVSDPVCWTMKSVSLRMI